MREQLLSLLLCGYAVFTFYLIFCVAMCATGGKRWLRAASFAWVLWFAIGFALYLLPVTSKG